MCILAGHVLLFNGCARYDYHRFIEYLKAERRLRAEANNYPDIDEKISDLQNEYRIDPENEIAKLNARETRWVKFLMDLNRAR